MTPEEALQRAERAKQLLNDPLLKETFDHVEQALVMAAKSSKTETDAMKACIAMQVFDILKNHIASHVETAKVVQFNEQKKRFGIF
jgi:hypothetical protein